MSILWHWTSNVWLRIFLNIGISLDLSPIVMVEAAEGAIGVSVLWHWSSNVWLWVLLDISIGLNLSPVIVVEAGES